jgi:quercetin dioxygenase-like cupin family protein
LRASPTLTRDGGIPRVTPVDDRAIMALMQSHSSRDFGRMEATIRVDVPDKLIHRDVERTNRDEGFSDQRKHPVFVVDLPSRVLSVTIGGLEPKQTTSKHRHSYEAILFVLEGEGFTMIEDRKVEWKAGDAVYIPVWAWHQHTNPSATRPCRYVACENAPMLQNLGVAIREDAG